MMSSPSKILASLVLLAVCNIACKESKSTTGERSMSDWSNVELVTYFNSFNPKWQEAIQRNDASYIIDQYDENAILDIPGNTRIIGKDNIATYWNNTVTVLDDFKYQTQHIGGNPDDILFESGTSFVSYTVNNQTIKDTSNYLFVWKYIGNQRYKVLAEMFN